MKYTFGIDTIIDPTDPNKIRKIAYISLDNHQNYGEFFIDEIRNLKVDYLSEIVSQLKKILTSEIPHYDFGFEIYNFDCTKDECKVLNTFEGWRVECELPTKEIYQLLRDWRNYLIQFNESPDNPSRR